MSRTIFSTVRAPHDPAFTVGSLAMTHTGRPSTRPTPVTTPSAGRSSAGGVGEQARPRRTSPRRAAAPGGRARTACPARPASRRPWRGCPPAPARLRRRASSSGGRAPTARHVRSRRMARMATSSLIGLAMAKSRGRLEQRLAQHVGGRRRGRAAACWRCAPRRTAARRCGPRPGRRCRAAAGRRRRAGSRGCGSCAVGVEHQQRAGGPQRPDLAVVPQPRRRVAGRREPQRAGVGVEHHDARAR